MAVQWVLQMCFRKHEEGPVSWNGDLLVSSCKDKLCGIGNKRMEIVEDKIYISLAHADECNKITMPPCVHFPMILQLKAPLA